MKKIMILMLFVLSGCAGMTPTERESVLEQQSRESIAAGTTTEVVRSASIETPEITFKHEGKDGSKYEVVVPATSEQKVEAKTAASENSDQSAKGKLNDSITIPLYWKIIGLAVGIGLLAAVIFVIIWFVRRSSMAVNAVWMAADQTLTDLINSNRSKQSLSTDPAVILNLKAEEAELLRKQAENLRD